MDEELTDEYIKKLKLLTNKIKIVNLIEMMKKEPDNDYLTHLKNLIRIRFKPYGYLPFSNLRVKEVLKKYDILNDEEDEDIINKTVNNFMVALRSRYHIYYNVIFEDLNDEE